MISTVLEIRKNSMQKNSVLSLKEASSLQKIIIYSSCLHLEAYFTTLKCQKVPPSVT